MNKSLCVDMDNGALQNMKSETLVISERLHGDCGVFENGCGCK